MTMTKIKKLSIALLLSTLSTSSFAEDRTEIEIPLIARAPVVDPAILIPYTPPTPAEIDAINLHPNSELNRTINAIEQRRRTTWCPNLYWLFDRAYDRGTFPDEEETFPDDTLPFLVPQFHPETLAIYPFTTNLEEIERRIAVQRQFIGRRNCIKVSFAIAGVTAIALTFTALVTDIVLRRYIDV